MSNEMDELIKRRQEEQKSKGKNQIPYAILILFIALILGIVFFKCNHEYLSVWFGGIAIGIILRYSRFCFAGAFRDPFIMKNTKLLRGMILGLIISTVGFAVIQYRYTSTYTSTYSLVYSKIPGSVESIGIHLVIGAFIFGVGMVLAGGCSSGVLMRIGEGHTLQWVVLLGFFIGTVMGAKDYPFWSKYSIANSKVIYLPEYIDLKIIVIVQITVLIILYIIALWYERKHSK
ncbi:YeeE/YedE thiosulfate transporter family protein [Clostridium sp. Marseille-Q2269]|uniref:YeeE/YedE thiosulfate transporter family protein n=1 Tax=Clostridium sp. Marseille-Q2269 TaxID=2942205 RepID=UPI002073610C|nr:YeeE/YedE thiosulfate transporter family protein [Clostridium sp. Marseille-Q2269]